MESDDSFSYEDSFDVDSGNVSSSDELDVRLEPSTSRVEPESDENLFQVLSVDELADYMFEEIKEVKDVAMLPETAVRMLLNHFHWDKEKLLEQLFDSDQERLFREAHVSCLFANTPVTPATSAASAAATSSSTVSFNSQTKEGVGGNETCELCISCYSSLQMFGLGCGHRFCIHCWRYYITDKVMDEGMSVTIACAGHRCCMPVDEASVARLVPDQRVLQRYKHLVNNSFVECNPLLAWCPSPDCRYSVRVFSADTLSVTCRCGLHFCFACAEAWHEPVRCQLLARWLTKSSQDMKTLNWLSANTKDCPKCKATIVKDGGCNHLVCKNQSCRAEFCWVCLGPWEPHGSSWYKCNRYDESEAQAARETQQSSRASLNRYLFYFNRYANHKESIKLENRLYTTAKDKVEELQQHVMSWIEIQFLNKAIDTLCECRQTLMYTYVFAYYLEPNNQTHIFEDNQKDLEISTETLSEYLEREITKENLTEIKQKVQDKYKYCDSRRKLLVGHVLEGYERDWWHFMD